MALTICLLHKGTGRSERHEAEGICNKDKKQACGAAVVEEPEPEEPTEQPKAERNISADVMKLAAVTRGLKIDPEWTKEETIKAVSEYSGLPEEEIEVLLESTAKWA